MTGVLIVLVNYTFTKGEVVRVEREIRYQVLDFGQGDFLRSYFEQKFRDRNRVFVINEKNEKPWFYVSNSDFKKCWPESPMSMREAGYTIIAEFEYKEQIFWDVSPAKVTKERHLNNLRILFFL